MGTVLAVGGWVSFEDAAAKEAWQKKAVASVKLTGWDGPLEGPGDSSPLDKHTIGKLWAEARDAPEPIDIAETETGLRFAAAFASVTGRTVWAPAFFAAIRRAAGTGQGGAWALAADEGGSVLSVDLGGRGSFRLLDEDAEAEAALAEPELVRACALLSGDPPPPTLAELPPRERVASSGAGKRKAAGKGSPEDSAARIEGDAKRPARDEPSLAKPAPRLKKITTRTPGGVSGVTRLAGGDVVMIGLFGQWIRGSLETKTWASRPLGLGKLRWITSDGPRIWLGGYEGTFVSDDDGQTFTMRLPESARLARPLFVEGAMIGALDGELARSTDEGVTWTKTFPWPGGFGGGPLARGAGAFSNRLVAAGMCGRVAVSDDLGQTWTMVRDPGDEAINAGRIDGDDVFFVGSRRVLRASIGSPGEVVEVGPPRKRNGDFGRIYASGGTLWVTSPVRLLRSRDRGASWEIIAQAQTVFTDVLALGPRHLLVPTSDEVAYEVEG